MEQVVPNEFQQPVQGPDPEITQILQEAGRPNMIERPILVLHSPQLIGQQVLRPIVYNFNDEVKNRVYDGSIKHGNGAYFLSPRDGSEDVLRASMVATDGILLDTTPIEQNWTFMFIMKGHNAAMQYVPGSNVTVAIGYVYSENGDVPVSPYGAINDNAILVFTHCLVGNSTADYGAAGGQVRLMAFGADATGCAISRTCGNPLYAATPKDMLQIGLGIGFDGSPSTPEVMAMKEQTYCLSNPTNGDLVGYKIGSNLRSPQEHLYSLTRAIGSGTRKYDNGKFEDNLDFIHRKPYITEGATCHYTWYVPQNVEGLIDMLGGPAKFETKLDSMFTEGRYWHGNEPCHQIAYLYDFIGKRDKTIERVAHILDTEYNDSPGGLSGNDDAGQMSAWYVFSSMGFYPVCPATDRYMLSAPRFQKVTLNLEGGKKFVITPESLPKDRNYITHDEIVK